MGTCECDNPMEFGYEVNSSEKDEGEIFKIKEKKEKEKEKKNFYSELNYKEKNNNNPNINVNLNQGGVTALKTRIEEIPQEKININTNVNNINIDNNNDNTSSNFYFTTTSEKPKDDFSLYIFENINKIRENPQSFIKEIEQAKKNVFLDQRGIYIYKNNVKVALSKGLPAFDDAINILKKLNPMNKLIFSNDLVIDSPINEEQIKDKKYMNEQINTKVQRGIPIKSFWRDIIKDPHTCLILMIVDDTGINSGKKRNDILDPNMQCIGIISKKIGKSFGSYITLC